MTNKCDKKRKLDKNHAITKIDLYETQKTPLHDHMHKTTDLSIAADIYRSVLDLHRYLTQEWLV